MSLELRKDSRRFYARITVGGERKLHPLDTKYEGIPPKGLRMKLHGDAAFERSRGEALAEEKKLKAELKEKAHKVKTLKKIYRLKTGEVIEFPSIMDLYSLEKTKVRERKVSEKHLKDVHLALTRFLAFLKSRYPKVEDAGSVTREIAEAFILFEQGSGNYTAKTVNNHKGSLAAAFETALSLDRIFKNPFAKIPDLEEFSEHRRPFTIEQMAAILDVAKEDPLMYPLIVTAMTTAMRLGDCCCLKWSSVKEDIQQIEVLALRKTMGTASIPYYGLLRAVFDEAKAEASDSEFVFPKAQQYYEGGMPHIFADRFERILLHAGFTDDDNPETSIRLTRGKGGRKASIRGFHSFKTTWVTFALMSGIPIEVIKHITGNQVVEIVLKHYFQPGLKEMRNLVRSKMPGLITDGDDIKMADVKLDRVQMLQMIKALDEKNWRQVRAEMIRILE